MSELTHSVSVNPDSLAIRFYLWLYDADPKKINTCKLFWAFIFALPALLIVVPIAGTVRLLVALVDRWRKSPPEEGPYGLSREGRLDKVSSAISASYARHSTLVHYLWVGLLVAACIGGVGGFVYALIVATIKTLIALAWIIGICLLMIATFFVLDFFAKGRGRGFIKLMSNLYRSVHDHTCARVELQ